MFRLAGFGWVLVPTVLVAQEPPATASRDSQPVAITHVTVIDVAQGQRLPEQTVLTEGSRIAVVGPAATVHLPAGARVLDGRGKFLIPGLWDMHAHAVTRWAVAAPLYLANGVLGLREIGTALPLDSIAAHRWALRVGRITGPRYVASGPLLVGRRSTLPETATVVLSTPEAAQRVVDSLSRAGADFIKVHNYLSRDIFFAIARAARSRGLPFAGHLPHVVSVREGSDSGMGSMEHLRGLQGACSADEEAYLSAQRAAHEAGAPDRDTSKAGLEAFLRAVNSYSPARCRAMGALLARNGTWVTPTLIRGVSFRVSPDSLLKDSRLRYVPARIAEEWRRQLMEPSGDTGWAVWQRQRSRIVPELQRVGVGLLVGTDANYSGPHVLPGFAVHDEMALFVDAGLTPLEALRAATWNPARYLKATDSLGTVAAGKLADLVLLDADPLVDIHNTQQINAVIANGRLFDRNAIDALLAGAARASNPERASTRLSPSARSHGTVLNQ